MSHSADHTYHGNGTVASGVFWYGSNVPILWSWWTPSSAAAYAFSLVVVSVFAFSRRWLEYVQARRKEVRLGLVESGEEFPAPGRQLSPTRLAPDSKASVCISEVTWLRFEQVALKALSVTLTYLVMLVVMTFNAGLFAAVILGECAGYVVFDVRPALEARSILPVGAVPLAQKDNWSAVPVESPTTDHGLADLSAVDHDPSE